MAEVKIYLGPNETEEDAKALLQKALTHHEEGGEHREVFNQPAARDVYDKIMTLHSKTVQNILKEISKVIDEEVD